VTVVWNVVRAFSAGNPTVIDETAPFTGTGTGYDVAGPDGTKPDVVIDAPGIGVPDATATGGEEFPGPQATMVAATPSVRSKKSGLMRLDKVVLSAREK
jgi:hypothetical protein